ncbi:hypothetical protein DSC_05940 [Pseudoxanthomonas spadix BD-a59]|uniref:Uncharacterized protein n=1 Tax=Pseudoxanthomonas spadix (strain BD-a59) TaxID=1045855 RepID=G7UR28_PSEUP|nr:hypothetical protein DSC_05940 [Pseudoxanthomonas spadix BD-a59]
MPKVLPRGESMASQLAAALKSESILSWAWYGLLRSNLRLLAHCQLN